MVAWCGKCDMPTAGRVHLPFWSKKPVQGVIIEALHLYHLTINTEMHQQLPPPPGQEEMVVLTPPPNEDEDDAAGSSKGGKGDCHAMGVAKAKRGGWMPKMAQMIATLWHEDYAAAKLLRDAYTDQSFMLKQLADQHYYRNTE